MAAGQEWAEVNGIDTVVGNLEIFAESLRQRAWEAADEIGFLLESYAKGDHPWKPETGATDASTRHDVVDAGGDIIEIYLSAGMDYDVFLELARGGKWAWLWPSVEANKDNIQKILVKRLGNGRVA
jgi:hypothetical protein